MADASYSPQTYLFVFDGQPSPAVAARAASAEVAVVEKPLLGNALIGQACATASWTGRLDATS